MITNVRFLLKRKWGKKGIVGFSQCYPNTFFNRWKVGILPICYFLNLYSLQERIKINYKGMWGRWYTFNCSSPGQLCIVYLGLPVQTALTICPCSGNHFSSVIVEEKFISGLLSLQWDYGSCGWQEESSVSGICWAFCSSPDFHRIRDTYHV